MNSKEYKFKDLEYRLDLYMDSLNQFGAKIVRNIADQGWCTQESIVVDGFKSQDLIIYDDVTHGWGGATEKFRVNLSEDELDSFYELFEEDMLNFFSEKLQEHYFGKLDL